MTNADNMSQAKKMVDKFMDGDSRAFSMNPVDKKLLGLSKEELLFKMIKNSLPVEYKVDLNPSKTSEAYAFRVTNIKTGKLLYSGRAPNHYVALTAIWDNFVAPRIRKEHNIKNPLTYLNDKERAELYNLYHLARTALSGGDDSKYNRKIWASKEFHKLHPEISRTSAYLEFDSANPLTTSEKDDLYKWGRKQFAISQHYVEDPPRAEFYWGRAVAAGKIAKMFNPIKWNINAPVVGVSDSDLGGSTSTFINISLDPKSEWKNNIYYNSRYVIFEIDNGILKILSKHYSLPKMRASKVSSPENAISKINKYISEI
jgi:hypothetical protein